MNKIHNTAAMPKKDNVLVTLRDADGNLKQLWNMNPLGKVILSVLRKVFTAYQPTDERYTWKAGLALYGVQIPFLTGSWQSKLSFHNLVTNAGFAGAASRLNGSGAEAAFTWIAVGTGTTPANVADTTLETELAASGLSRANSVASRVTTTVTDDTARLNNQFTVTGTVAVTESGVLNAGAAGVLLTRQVFAAINVNNGDTLDVTWDVAHA